ncbi:MAG TPA: single-stranded DNA-binding protein [Aggregatilineales bacterium]|nr:single-stranded DNA-binding protein [Anaerolineales bacterium]HRE47444.1 single-stranded DNA-binding protein [Aggregatilineales bacterium]
MWQQLIIVGNVGRDPKFDYSGQGLAYCKFSVAVSKRTGKGEERKEETTWFSVTIFGNQAELASQLIKKGRKVMLVGEISASTYISKQTNQPVASLDMIAREFRLLDSQRSGEEGGTGGDDSGGGSGGKDGGDLPF